MNRTVFWAAVAVLVTGCRLDSTISVRLVDPRLLPAWGAVPLYQVEVRRSTSVPAEALERFWRKADRVDIVPNIRTPATPAVLGDTLLVGFGGFGYGSVDVFVYDVRSRTVVRSGLPIWLNDLAFTPPPAFSPEARYLAYLAAQQDGTVQLEVRSWPDGAPLAVSAPVRPNPGSYRGAIGWRNAGEFVAGFPIMSDTGPVWLLLSGRAGGGSAQLDSVRLIRDSRPTIVASSVQEPPEEPAARNGPPGRQNEAAAAAETMLLPLDSFPNLPPHVRRRLERLGCSVPQSPYVNSWPNNVVHGEFARRGQTDWAALCATGDSMVVVVVWGGPSACPDTIAATAERVARHAGLGTADSAYVQSHEEMYGEGRPYPVRHDGIEVGIEDKASSVWYCHEGVWRLLPGAD